MKSYYIFLFLLFSSTFNFAQEISLPVQAGWQFRQAGKTTWMEAKIPGSVYADLLHNGQIKDPHFSTKERDLQWIEREDWEYKTTFAVDGEIITKDEIVLDFHGLDSYADVFLNDSCILVANNMFRSWEVDISSIVRQGDNELRIFFHSPIKKTAPIYDSLGYTLPVTSADRSDKKLSVFSRKAQYHFGSASGPRLVTSGIWKPISLRAWDTAQFKNVYLEQKSLGEEEAKILVNLEYEATRPFIGELEILVDGKPVKKTTVELNLGFQNDNVNIVIPKPELWWPSGYGSQRIYEIEVRLKREDNIVATKTIKTGLRTIELVQEKDNDGHAFYFKINGKPIFAKGANYVPQDYFLANVNPKRYEDLLQSAIEANMNMIRVWGGGIYETDLFYELCDQKGLLVWQDFMFSSAMYPGDSSFINNVRHEAEENVARLRHHPSVALWCGNDEVLMHWQKWKSNANIEGDQPVLWNDKKDSISMVKAYQRLFKEVLPSAVDSHSQGVPYWESSPSSFGGTFANRQSGDNHNWGVGHEKAPFIAYQSNVGRFMSAYGLPSFPEMKTMEAIVKKANLNINSEEVKALQSMTTGNESIVKYLDDYYKKPMDFEGFLYLSQLLQAEGAKMAIEAHRLNKPTTMGSLIWQLNESWPGVSPSGIDYFGRWKAMQYYTKRAFEDVIITFEAKGNELKIHGISDDYDDNKGVLIVELVDVDGKVISREEKKVRIKHNANNMLWRGTKSTLLKKEKPTEVYLNAKLILEGKVPTEAIFLFVPYKNIELETPSFKFDFNEKKGKVFVELTSDKPAFGVCLESGDMEVSFSDNYFFLPAKASKSIEIKGDFSIKELKYKLTVKSLVDSYAR